MTRIFQLACFVGCAGWEGSEAFTPGPLLFHRALHFAIVLLFYSGARREEICGLAIEDIRDFEIRNRRGQTETWPRLMIRPNTHRRLQNAQSLRVIPLYPEVIRLGFIPHVEAMRGLRPIIATVDGSHAGSSVGRSPRTSLRCGLPWRPLQSCLRSAPSKSAALDP